MDKDKIKKILGPLASFLGISGRVGDVVFRQVRGKTIIAKRPEKPRHLTRHQQIRKATFKLASEYAKEQMRNPAAKAEYSTGITDRKISAYVVAVSDFLNAPVIHAVDISRYRGVPGDTISIKATDDFKVTSVKVIITNSAGEPVEQGEAKRKNKTGHRWYYKATRSHANLPGTTITVAVRDKPGNTTLAKMVFDQARTASRMPA
jgi:hypothetical protein